jgi:hypothetical protein
MDDNAVLLEKVISVICHQEKTFKLLVNCLHKLFETCLTDFLVRKESHQDEVKARQQTFTLHKTKLYYYIELLMILQIEKSRD